MEIVLSQYAVILVCGINFFFFWFYFVKGFPTHIDTHLFGNMDQSIYWFHSKYNTLFSTCGTQKTETNVKKPCIQENSVLMIWKRYLPSRAYSRYMAIFSELYDVDTPTFFSELSSRDYWSNGGLKTIQRLCTHIMYHIRRHFVSSVYSSSPFDSIKSCEWKWYLFLSFFLFFHFLVYTCTTTVWRFYS